MREKGTLFSSIVAIISLVFLGYVLFISIYDQMISQNEGFFYVAVFGGILVLAFILLSLMTKLMALSNEIKNTFLWYVIEVIGFIVIVALFLVTRLSYKSSLPADESLFYKTAYVMSESSLANAGRDLIPQLIRKPGQFLYARFVSVIFMFFEAEQSIILNVNIVFVVINLIFAYLTVRQIGGRACALVATACSVFMPCQSFAIYTYDAQVFFSAFFFGALALIVNILKDKSKNIVKPIILSVILGILLGVIFSMEPTLVIVYIMIMIYMIPKIKKGWLMGLITFVCSASIFLLLSLSGASKLGVDMPELMEGYFNRFVVDYNEDTGVEYEFKQVMSNFHGEIDNQDKQITDNYYFLSNKSGNTYSALQAAWFQLGNQLLYLFLMVLAVAGSFYLIRSRNTDIIPLYLVFIGSIFVLFFESSKERNTFFFVEILIAIASCSLKYMYDNHHPEANRMDAFYYEDIISEMNEAPSEEVVEEIEEEDEDQFLIRARALVFIGENERLYREIIEEEKSQLRSPREKLPLPDISFSGGLASKGRSELDSSDFSLSASFGEENQEAPSQFAKGIKLPTLQELNEKTPVNRTIIPAVSSKSTEGKPVEGKPAEGKPVEGKPTEGKLTKDKTAKNKPAKEEAYYFDEDETFKPKKKVKLLDNPLPGPKKHVPRTLDYGHDVSKAERDGYDYDINDSDDDFDV